LWAGDVLTVATRLPFACPPFKLRFSGWKNYWHLSERYWSTGTWMATTWSRLVS
jgi:hypothetical protein